MTALLSTQGLAYGHPGRTLGRDIDLNINAGEVLCVLGPNGSGKTTLFRTLLGLLPAHAGDITLNAKPLAAHTAAERATCMAYVPQAGNSYFAFTVREVVLMGRTAHLGLFAAPGTRDLYVADASMEELRIGHLAEIAFTDISGGERQLALIARALAQASPLLIMDEPTANLDVGNQILILDEIQRLKASGRSVIFCSHDPDHALRTCGHSTDQVLLLHDGKALACGRAQDIVTPENLATLYGIGMDIIESRSGGQRFCRPAHVARNNR